MSDPLGEIHTFYNEVVLVEEVNGNLCITLQDCADGWASVDLELDEAEQLRAILAKWIDLSAKAQRGE